MAGVTWWRRALQKVNICPSGNGSDSSEHSQAHLAWKKKKRAGSLKRFCEWIICDSLTDKSCLDILVCFGTISSFEWPSDITAIRRKLSHRWRFQPRLEPSFPFSTLFSHPSHEVHSKARMSQAAIWLILITVLTLCWKSWITSDILYSVMEMVKDRVKPFTQDNFEIV